MDRKSATELLHELGYNPEFIAAGMEGFVFDIGNDMLAKVWTKKDYTEVWQLRSFYAKLKEKQLPFATPQIYEVAGTSTGVVVSTEERLSGVTLRNILDRHPDNDSLSKKGMTAVVSVVEALKTAGDILGARELELLDESSSWSVNSTWNIVLGNLVALRIKRYKAVLSRAVLDIERIATRVISLLNELQIAHIGVIHGDICPENVLVDEATITPIGLLDFGFLTTSADPLFDAVISTLIFDMYSPYKQQVRENLRAMYSEKLGKSFEEIYPLYRAAYALVTSNAYSENGEDGHFQWCVDILNDEETYKLLS